MKYWQSLSMTDIDELPTLAQWAEELKFEGVILSDHLITFNHQYDKYVGNEEGTIIWNPDTHWPDPWVTISALSQITTRLKFMTAVYVLPMRDPFTAAKAISTAARFSNNRLILGVGIGWQEMEFNVIGAQFSDRGKRTDEMLAVMKLLMTEQMVEHHGAFYDFDLLNMAPGTTKPIEIVIGGLSDAALARAAKHDGWIGGEHSMEELVDFVSSFKQQRDRQGIPSAKPFNLYSCVKDYDDNKCKIAEQLGVTVYRNTWLQDGKAGAIPLKTKMNDMETFAKRYIL